VGKKLEERLPAYIRIIEVSCEEMAYSVQLTVPADQLLSQGDAHDIGLWLLRASRVAGTLEKVRRKHGRPFVRQHFGLEEPQ
jgi:hypothetical protein